MAELTFRDVKLMVVVLVPAGIRTLKDFVNHCSVAGMPCSCSKAVFPTEVIQTLVRVVLSAAPPLLFSAYERRYTALEVTGTT
jgi:hypothetical protein